MKIGGFQRNSLIDFPGKIACVVFTSGCNFFCPYCHNPGIAGKESEAKPAVMEEKELFSFLEKRKKYLEGVVITGGEPTLQKDLELFCSRIRSMGYQIKLDTNGSRPEVLNTLYRKKLVDFTAMDVKTNVENYYMAAGRHFNTDRIMSSISLIMNHSPNYEFRTTCVKPFIDKKIICDIGEMISSAVHYVLQPCSKNAAVMSPEFFEQEDRFFSDSEIEAFAVQAEQYVQKCSVR